MHGTLSPPGLIAHMFFFALFVMDMDILILLSWFNTEFTGKIAEIIKIKYFFLPKSFEWPLLEGRSVKAK